MLCKSLGNGLANAAGAPGDNCNFAIKSKWIGARGWIGQGAIPRFLKLSALSAWLPANSRLHTRDSSKMATFQ
jgi:hypothetical protein